MWLPSVIILSWLRCCTAYDAVLFSVLPVRKTTVEELTTSSSKMLTIGVRHFSLAMFSVYVGAYGDRMTENSLSSIKKTFSNFKAVPIENHIKIPKNDFDTEESTRSHKKHLSVNHLEELETLFQNIQDLRHYDTVLISSTEAFETELVRHKRVSSDVTFHDDTMNNDVRDEKQGNRQQMAAPNAKTSSLPVVLPFVDESGSMPKNKTCLLYMEAFDIILLSKKDAHFLTVGSEDNNIYAYDPLPDYYICDMVDNRGKARFVIEVRIGNTIEQKDTFFLRNGTIIKLQLDFTGVEDNGYWYLSETTLVDDFKIDRKEGDPVNVRRGTALNTVDVGSVSQFSFACSQTQAASFNTSDSSYPLVAVSLRNFEVNLGLKSNKAQFGYYTTDCIGTFSAGSWMGFIVAIVLISILLFGYLMIHSIQTMDRFDDPKHKQFVINYKE